MLKPEARDASGFMPVADLCFDGGDRFQIKGGSPVLSPSQTSLLSSDSETAVEIFQFLFAKR
jgi:hypothetical protein